MTKRIMKRTKSIAKISTPVVSGDPKTNPKIGAVMTKDHLKKTKGDFNKRPLETKSLIGKFYIVCTKEETDWWQLRYNNDQHFVFSAGQGRVHILECLRKIILRYKDYDTIVKQVKRCEFKTNKEEITRRCKEYKEVGVYSVGDCDDIIREALEEVKTKKIEKKVSKTKRILNRTNLVHQNSTSEKTHLTNKTTSDIKSPSTPVRPLVNKKRSSRLLKQR